MPEYLAPGVYVEEVSFRAKSIEGVSTSIAGMVGPTRFGPVGGEPELLTSFTEFERQYGGIDRLRYGAGTPPVFTDVTNYVAFAVRSFFENGGTKLYVTRIFGAPDGAADGYGRASLSLPLPAPVLLSLGTTDTSVASAAFSYGPQSILHQDAIPAGTALAAGTIPKDKWGVYRFSLNPATGKVVSTAGAANFAAGYDSDPTVPDAKAAAAVPAVPAGQVDMGFVTVLTKIGKPFIGGTDSLANGAAGNVAAATNYRRATPAEVTIGARFPGRAGNLTVRFEARVRANVLQGAGALATVSGVNLNDVVFIGRSTASLPPVPPPMSTPPTAAEIAAAKLAAAAELVALAAAAQQRGFFSVSRDAATEDVIFIGPDGTQIALNTLDAATDVVRPISVVVVTRGPGQFDSEHPFGEFDFATEHRTSLDNYFQPMPESRRRRLTVPISITLPGSPSGARVAQLLFPDLENAMQDARDIERWRKQPASTPNRPTVDAWRTARLAVSAGMSAEWDLDGGIDGVPPSPADYEGHDDGKQKFGLMSFEDVEDISIVSAPG